METTNELNVIFGTGPLAQATMRALLKRGKGVVLLEGRERELVG